MTFNSLTRESDQSIVLEGVSGDISQGIVINTLINGKEATLTVTDSDTTHQTAPEKVGWQSSCPQ